MLAFSIERENLKYFMSKLLKETTFDTLEVRNIALETIVKYEIQGNINKDYLETSKDRFFVKWHELKPYIFSLIQGKRKPKSLKIVFSLPEEETQKLHENAQAMFLNLTYENDEILGTTGTSQKVFSLDKELDIIWESTVLKFLEENNIKVKILQ